ncbi:hypothetical protein H0H81_005799 [Sphagnurus paluster]|uniref:Arsenite methyltransferase n=1 Tax=Sphagnurus paluster TaxID=117069 RepID=A0A9P7GKC3_9AGAR|nr:hypothetical protein H0H81_005799 [Sphagnurus paluster]
MPDILANYLTKAVADAYGEKAISSSDNTYTREVAQSVGYTDKEMDSIPASANMGVGCGSPVAAANLKQGETVVDLGSGGGIDVLIAAAKVGTQGKVIGLDISPEMISLARRNANAQGIKPPHASFVETSLAEPLPIASHAVDCVLSNCVINLVPSTAKEDLLKEVHRILKPGGRFVLDDIITKQRLPDDVKEDLTSYINCISGSIQVDEYKILLQKAGFNDFQFRETKNDLKKICSGVNNACTSSSGPKSIFNVNDWVASYQITASKSVNVEEGVKQNVPDSVLLRWWDAYPKIKSSPAAISPEYVSKLMKESAQDLAVIDVRRYDRVGDHVRGSDNWPAQTFYDDLPKFLEKYRNTRVVAFYCGSSSGRGPRCAGWYQDHLNETAITTSTAYVLQGGVKAWLAKYGNDDALVERD